MIADFFSNLTAPGSAQAGPVTLVTTLFGAIVSVPLGLRVRSLLHSAKKRAEDKKAGLRLLHSLELLKGIMNANACKLGAYRDQIVGGRPLENPGLNIKAQENLSDEFLKRVEPPELVEGLGAHFDGLWELMQIHEALRVPDSSREPGRRAALLKESMQRAEVLRSGAIKLSHVIEGARLRVRRQVLKRRRRRDPLTGRC